jgi:hypothetical protein
MTERLLQFIWQFQYFNRHHLQTTSGEALQIIRPGQFNTNQGPDFLDASIKVGNIRLIGNIELHIHERDWQRHAHANDPNYRNIILHVLWEPPDRARLSLPTLCLSDRVPKMLLKRYGELMQSGQFVPCSNNIQVVSDLTWLGWKERLLAERLLRKSAQVQYYLRETGHHWEEVFWWMLARNFGIFINADAFEAVARSLPLTMLSRHRNRLYQVESLLLGQAGLLETDFQDGYPRMLRDEYRFYTIKYGLQPVRQQVHFLRMRPGNFPTIRLAQLSMLLHRSGPLFSLVRDSSSVKDLHTLLQVGASEYWESHYVPDEPTPARRKTVGKQMVENIIINTIMPVLFCYGHLKQEQQFKDRVIDWLEELEPEDNSITRGWVRAGVENRHARDSQALITLKKDYCDARRCLECAVGNTILGSNDGILGSNDGI